MDLMCRILDDMRFEYCFGAECAEYRVFHGKYAFLELKWTESAEC